VWKFSFSVYIELFQGFEMKGSVEEEVSNGNVWSGNIERLETVRSLFCTHRWVIGSELRWWQGGNSMKDG
jgi:hypothetical protein